MKLKLGSQKECTELNRADQKYETSNIKTYILEVVINRHGWLRKLTPVVNKMRRVET